MSPIPTPSLDSLRVGARGPTRSWDRGGGGVPFLGYLRGVLSKLQSTPRPWPFPSDHSLNKQLREKAETGVLTCSALSTTRLS